MKSSLKNASLKVFFSPLLPPVYFLLAKFIFKRKNTTLRACHLPWKILWLYSALLSLSVGAPPLELSTKAAQEEERGGKGARDLPDRERGAVPGSAVSRPAFCFRYSWSHRQAGCTLCYLRTLDQCGSLCYNLILEEFTHFTFLVGGFPTFLDSWWHFNNFFLSAGKEKHLPIIWENVTAISLEWGLGYESVFFCFFILFMCRFTRHSGLVWNLPMTSMGQRNWSSGDSCNAPSLLRFYSFPPGWHLRQILSIKPSWLSTKSKALYHSKQ